MTRTIVLGDAAAHEADPRDRAATEPFEGDPMTPHDIAEASTIPVSRLASNFMLDSETFTWAAGKGFENIDFYFGGRLGVLGEAPSDVAAAAITFFNPEVVHTGWEGAGKVMSRVEAAVAFAGQAYRWADDHLPD
ncbi:hypothetical protein B7486_65375, partial [cyanobacterium TDX16]